MYSEGHMGVSLLLGSPILLAMSIYGYTVEGFLFILTVASLASLPDIDMNTSSFKHRGFTHTVWFGVIVGTTLAVIGTVIGYTVTEGVAMAGFEISILTGYTITLVFLFGGITGIVFHTIGDIFTPSGVSIAPPYITEVGLGLFTADNYYANIGFLYLGVASVICSYMIIFYGLVSIFVYLFISIYVVFVPIVIIVGKYTGLSYNGKEVRYIDWFNLKNYIS